MEDVGESDDEDDGALFINPLSLLQSKKKEKKSKKNADNSDISEGEWSADEDDEKALQKEKKKDKKERDGGKLGKRKKREDEDDVADFFKSKEIETVPVNDMEDGYSSMDSDDIAETRALAKLMLRKKARTEILDSTYNRYSHFDDPNVLPEWFKEDEQKHYRPNLPITKEQIAEEK